MTEAMEIRFSGLDVGYGDGLILSGLDGIVRPGVMTALIGSNGSGKSTLIRTFAGLLPYGGSLILGKRELSGMTRAELGRLLGVVPQHTKMTAQFTVFDAVELGRLPYQGLAGTGKLSEADERIVMQAVARTELDHLLLRDVTRLSGGEAQRVSVATVLAQDPPVMLLDEPSSALDPRHTVKVFHLLRELADAGKTVVVAAHDVNLAAGFADFFFAMKNGKILFDAPVEELDGDVLEQIYDATFEPYVSDKGEKVWHTK